MKRILLLMLVCFLIVPTAFCVSDEEIDDLALAFALMDLETLKIIHEEVEKAIQQKEPTISSNIAAELQVATGSRLTPKTLHKSYDNNAINADVRYKGVTIEIEGYVKSIDKEPFFGNRIYINVSSSVDSWDFDTVMCYLKPAENEKVLSLSKGDHIVISGVGDGMAFTSIIMNDCTIVSPGI